MRKHITLAGTLCLLISVALATASCKSSEKQAQPKATSVQSTVSATPIEGDVNDVIERLFLEYERVQQGTIDDKIYFTDSSGEDWTRFETDVTDVVCGAGPQSGPAGAVSGIIKKAPDGDWELVDFGIGDIQCGVPAEVQAGLGFATCPAREEELNRAIKDWLLRGPVLSRKDSEIKIARKVHYTDPSGTDWAEFCLLAIPDVSSSTYGIMKRLPGGNWEGVNFGSAAVECGLPADVQSGLGFPYCAHG